MQSVKGMSYSTTTAQSTTTATSTPPTNMARNAESSFSQDNPAYNTNSELAIEKPKIPNLIKYDGFHSSSFHLLVELGTNPRLVLDDGFLAKLLLPRLVMVLTEHQKKEISLVAGLSQFKCQFEVPQTWFKRFHAANARIMLSSKAQYATVWTHAVDCAIWSGHVDRCGLSAKQRELEIQQVRGLINHTQFQFKTRAGEISRLEDVMRLRRRDGVPFDGIQTQIDKLKKPMRFRHRSKLELMRNTNDTSDPKDFNEKPVRQTIVKTTARTTARKHKRQTRRSRLYSLSRGPDQHIENTLPRNEIRTAEESTTPRPLVTGGPQRSGNNMIPLAFNRLQHRSNTPVDNSSEFAPNPSVSPYEMNLGRLAGKQAFSERFTSMPEDIQQFPGEFMDDQERRKRLWSDVVPQYAGYLQPPALASYEEGGHADGLPRDVGAYNVYDDIDADAAYPFHSGPNPPAQMSGYDGLVLLGPQSSHQIPKPSIESWSKIHAEMVTEAMFEHKQPLTCVKPEWDL